MRVGVKGYVSSTKEEEDERERVFEPQTMTLVAQNVLRNETLSCGASSNLRLLSRALHPLVFA